MARPMALHMRSMLLEIDIILERLEKYRSERKRALRPQRRSAGVREGRGGYGTDCQRRGYNDSNEMCSLAVKEAEKSGLANETRKGETPRDFEVVFSGISRGGTTNSREFVFVGILILKIKII